MDYPHASALPAPLDPEKIHNFCAEASNEAIARSFQIRTVAETGSTNDDAFAAAASQQVHTGFVIFADRQTVGRGRRGDRWEAPPGSSLLFSLVIRPDDSFPPHLWPRLPHLAGITLARTVETVLDDYAIPAKLKWPNDLYLEEKKAAGILVESHVSKTSTTIVVGIGLNVNTALNDFPTELQTTATSLTAVTKGPPTDRNLLAGRFLAEWAKVFPSAVDEAVFAGLVDELKHRSTLLDRRVTLTQNQRRRRGKVVGIGPDGELLFRDEAEGDPSKPPESVFTADHIRLVDE